MSALVGPPSVSHENGVRFALVRFTAMKTVLWEPPAGSSHDAQQTAPQFILLSRPISALLDRSRFLELPTHSMRADASDIVISATRRPSRCLREDGRLFWRRRRRYWWAGSVFWLTKMSGRRRLFRDGPAA